MTVIVVDNSLDVTGAFKAVVNNILVDTTGRRYIYFIPAGSRNKEYLERLGITVYTFRSYGLSKQLKNLVLFLPFLFWNGRQLARIARRHRADLIYQNEIFIISGLVAKLFVRVKVLSHIRVLPTIFPKGLYRAWMWLHHRFADKIVTVSFTCKREAEVLYKGPKEISVFYDFVLPGAKHSPYVIRGREPFRVLFIGNYTRGKGQDLAIKTVAAFQKRNPQVAISLALYGSDFGYAPNIAYRKELVSYITAHGLSHSVHIHDFITDVEEVMKEADVLLNLSVAESFSFVVAEALTFGIPVVATDSGGPGELIEQGRSGILVPYEAEKIADVLAQLWRDEHLRGLISRNEKDRIQLLIKNYGGFPRFNKVLLEAAGLPEPTTN